MPRELQSGRLIKLLAVRGSPRQVTCAALRQSTSRCRRGGDQPVLATDIIHIADGGGVVRASINPVVGIDRVSRLLAGLRTKHCASMEMEVLMVNGLPAIGLFDNDSLHCIIGLDFRTDCIAAVYSLLNPDKLHTNRT